MHVLIPSTGWELVELIICVFRTERHMLWKRYSRRRPAGTGAPANDNSTRSTNSSVRCDKLGHSREGGCSTRGSRVTIGPRPLGYRLRLRKRWKACETTITPSVGRRNDIPMATGLHGRNMTTWTPSHRRTWATYRKVATQHFIVGWMDGYELLKTQWQQNGVCCGWCQRTAHQSSRDRHIESMDHWTSDRPTLWTSGTCKHGVSFNLLPTAEYWEDQEIYGREYSPDSHPALVTSKLDYLNGLSLPKFKHKRKG